MIVVSTGCTAPPDNQQDETGIITSFNALGLILEPVIGDLPVVNLLPAGVSPHAYAPRPSEVARLHHASIIVYAHPHIDGWIASMAPVKAVALFDDVWGTSSADATEEFETHPDASPTGQHDHGGRDPHVWNDPALVRKALPGLTDALCATYPDRCPSIRRQATVFSTTLLALEDSLAKVATTWHDLNPDECFISSQPFADRFLDRFGFTFVGPLSVSPDIEPSPGALSSLLSEASRHGCSTLILQDALENSMERRLASEHGWTVVSLDPLGTSSSTYSAYLGSLMSALTGHPSSTGQLSPSP